MNKLRLPNGAPFPAVSMPDVQSVYGFKIGEDGIKVFTVVAEQKITSEREAYRDMCDYKVIMESLAPVDADGEAWDALGESMEQYSSMDLSDPLAVVSFVESLKSDFESMPKEIRKKYGNNIELFARAVVSGELADFVAEQSAGPVETAQPVSKVVADGADELGDIRKQLEDIRKQVANAGKGEEK